MSWRTVIISSRCKLDLKMGYLVARGEEVKRIFLDEIALLLIENPAVAMTGCLLSALTEKKIKVIFVTRSICLKVSWSLSGAHLTARGKSRRKSAGTKWLRDAYGERLSGRKYTSKRCFSPSWALSGSGGCWTVT